MSLVWLRETWFHAALGNCGVQVKTIQSKGAGTHSKGAGLGMAKPLCQRLRNLDQ